MKQSEGMARLAELAELTGSEDYRTRIMAQGVQYALRSGRLSGSIDMYIRWSMLPQEVDALVLDVCKHCHAVYEIPHFIMHDSNIRHGGL